jgi:hypothetical protein
MEKDTSFRRLQMFVATQFFYGLWKDKANFNRKGWGPTTQKMQTKKKGKVKLLF